MERFTVEEANLICIYGMTGTRTEVIGALTDMSTELESDEKELMDLTKSVIQKLAAMSDTEYSEASDALVPDYEE